MNRFLGELEKIGVDIEGALKKLLGDAPTIIKDAKVAVAGIAVVAPELEPEATVALAGLTELNTVVTDFKPGTTPLSTAQNAVADVQANLTGIVSAAQVKNPGSVQTVTNVVNKVSTDLSVLVTSIAAVTPAPATPAAAAQ